MKKEKLLGMGFNEEQSNSIIELHKDAINNNFVPKHRFDEVNNSLKDAKTQISERDVQISSLKEFAGNTKELQEKIKEMESENSKKIEAYESNLKNERKINALKFELLNSKDQKPFDVDLVLSLFDVDSLSFDETTNKITSGFAEQIENLKKEKEFLFEPKEVSNNKQAWRAVGASPLDGDDPSNNKDNELENYGKSLAQVKLGMLGKKQQS